MLSIDQSSIMPLKMNYKKSLSFFVVLAGGVLVAIALVYIFEEASAKLINPLSSKKIEKKEDRLNKYAFSQLKSSAPQASQILLEELISENNKYHSYVFSYETQGKNMTGQINVPRVATPSAGFPAILMLRGFVDPSIYETGVGTRNGAAVFAENGFVTIAPDFLGFGGSDNPDSEVLGARLEKPKNVLDLLASLASLQFVDLENVGLWGHSNGGQIALSVLQITGKEFPTSLWAPVSKPFPFSILFYTDEYEDQGKALRRVVSDFEQDYDVFDFSIDKYWDWIKAPIQIHHGSADEAAPVEWSEKLEQLLRDQDVDVTFYKYEQADHNLRPDWSEVVSRDIDFYRSHLFIAEDR